MVPICMIGKKRNCLNSLQVMFYDQVFATQGRWTDRQWPHKHIWLHWSICYSHGSKITLGQGEAMLSHLQTVFKGMNISYSLYGNPFQLVSMDCSYMLIHSDTKFFRIYMYPAFWSTESQSSCINLQGVHLSVLQQICSQLHAKHVPIHSASLPTLPIRSIHITRATVPLHDLQGASLSPMPQSLYIICDEHP